LVVLEEALITHLAQSLEAVAVVAATTEVVAVAQTPNLHSQTVAVAVVDLASPTQLDSNQLYTQLPGSQLTAQPASLTT
jgi:Flp pilus assembly protein CpaB